MGCLVNACDVVPRAQRIASPEQLRSVLQVSDWTTGKHKADGEWRRFALVTSGVGGKLSNQRALRINPYIEGFTAEGEMVFDEERIEMGKFTDFMEFAGREVGIGASRKLGWGRFTPELQVVG
jgi:hypothetical protein